MVQGNSKGLYSPVDHRPHFPALETDFSIAPLLTMTGFVLDNLVITDRICFALSCKLPLAYYQIYTRHDEESYARFMSFISGGSSLQELPFKLSNYGPLSLAQRTELLLRLQGRDWKYCTDCMYFHRCSRWSFLRSYLNYDSHGQCRSPRASRLHICPRLSISLFQQHQFANASLNAENHSVLTETRLSACTRSLNLGCHGKYLDFEHECTFGNHPLVIVHTKSRAWFDKSTRTLRVLNIFRFDLSRAGPSELAVAGFGRASSKSCIHRDTEMWLNKFFRENKSSFNIGCRGLHWCEWLGWDETANPARIFTLILHRDVEYVKRSRRRWWGW